MQERTEVKPPTPPSSRAESRFAPGAMFADRLASPGAPYRVTAVVVGIVFVIVFRRYGVLALASTMTFFLVLISIPLTLDPSVWYFGRSFFVVSLLIAIAGYAFFLSLAGQPLVKLELLED